MTASACVEVRRSWVEVVLDTTPPALTITLDSRVSPPDTATATVVSSESVGASSYALVDATGHSWPLGADRLDDRIEEVLIPSVGLAGGDAWLLAIVADEVGNTVTRRVPFYVARPIPYDLDLFTSGVFTIAERTDAVLDLALDSRTIFDLVLTDDGIVEIDAMQAHLPFEMELSTYGD